MFARSIRYSAMKSISPSQHELSGRGYVSSMSCFSGFPRRYLQVIHPQSFFLTDHMTTILGSRSYFSVGALAPKQRIEHHFV